MSRLVLVGLRSKRVVFPHRAWLCASALPCAGPFNIQTVNSSTHTSLYETLFYKDSPPVWFAQQVLETGHDFTNLPWWASIILTTFALRTAVTLPFAVYQHYIFARLELLQPQIAQYGRQLQVYVKQKEVDENWGKNKSRVYFKMQMKKVVTALYIRDNIHPFKASLLLWVQLPMWVFISFALRNMTGAFPGKVAQEFGPLVPSMATEGALWFPDLTLPDPFVILPIILGLSNLLVIEMHALRSTKPTKWQGRITNLFRFFSVAMVPLAAYLPTGMSLYWASSSVYGLGQNLLLKSPKMRRIFQLPHVPSESTTPYKDMMKLAKIKFLRQSESK
ncbi:cytochrome c oxidase assembly protein COX18, mitochondrial-like [Saccoglossus kowalevskii]|uniref:Mitochondrial inner membrane protein COX18-like n=1 Tax=Saccoglossus kowalevskii TaxID=10224 RepID=A0ABM0GU00_SACKO|nr:PREDICTED: mitochondrial inner membrane protein COX18-like [Saccoglossus kowalevskii]